MNELPEPTLRAANISTWEVGGRIATSAEIRGGVWIADRRDGAGFVVAGHYDTREEAEHHAALMFISGAWSFE
jgi:hypothetical protein